MQKSKGGSIFDLSKTKKHTSNTITMRKIFDFIMFIVVSLSANWMEEHNDDTYQDIERPNYLQ